jgi:hypothetical protein
MTKTKQVLDESNLRPRTKAMTAEELAKRMRFVEGEGIDTTPAAAAPSPPSELPEPASSGGRPPETAQEERRPPAKASQKTAPSGEPRGRGRPSSGIKKKSTMLYLQPETHERLMIGADLAGRPMTEIVEEMVEAWVSKNVAQIDRIRSLRRESKDLLATKIKIS